MAFRDSSQRVLVSHLIFARLGFPNLCAINPPCVAERAFDDDMFLSLSTGQRILRRVALDAWNGRGHVRVEEVFELDSRGRRLVASLLSARIEGPEAVDRWIEEWSAVPR